VVAPTITSLSPASGNVLGNIPVIITGTSFTGATAVTFDGASLAFTVDSATQITASNLPHAIGAVAVAVTTPGGTATSAGAFTYTALTDLQATIQRLADIFNAQKAVIGISRAYGDSPASLTTLPAVCFFPGAQSYSPYNDAEDVKLERTTILVRVYEEHVQQGIPGEIETRLKVRIPLVRDLLLARPGLSLDATNGTLPGVKRQVLERASGVRSLLFAGEEFAGAEWSITVERIIEVTYAANE
jgi:hypothetical protein